MGLCFENLSGTSVPKSIRRGGGYESRIVVTEVPRLVARGSSFLSPELSLTKPRIAVYHQPENF